MSLGRFACPPAHHGPVRVLAAVAALATALLWAPVGAVAQHGDDVGQAPPPPPGPGELAVQVVGAATEALEGLPIALYALGPDGTPGLANGVTDAKGRAVFTGISNDPGIVYLIGARFAEIPFGERVTFVEGERSARVEIRVSEPTTRIAGVSVEEVRARLDWMGDRIVVTEIVRIESAGTRVIQVPSDPTGPAILERPLPAEARDWNAGPTSIGDELALVDGRVRFYGPLYPGEQNVEYQWSLPIDRGDRSLSLPITLRDAAERVVVVAGTSGLEVQGDGLVASRELADDSGAPLASWARGRLGGGETLELALTLPESRLDPTALAIPQANVWVDLDDTRLEANVDLTLQVTPGAPISGTPEAPLMHVTLPSGATLQGVAPEIETMGLVPTADGGFDVIGPIGPGEHHFGYAYRVASRPEGVTLDLRFPRAVQTLNVLIADNGLALDSERLHRRRPFRNGTRNYLHREAYNVGMDEVVDLTIEPLQAEGLPQTASQALTVAGAAAAALYLIAPLRSARRREDEGDHALAALREEREAIYTAIADLEHDYETGKLEEADYTAMRERFRGQAIELMRAEQAHAKAEGEAPPASAPAPADGPAHAPDATTSGPPISAAPTGSFCPSCGERVDPKWRFCSHCGGGLSPTGDAEQAG